MADRTDEDIKCTSCGTDVSKHHHMCDREIDGLWCSGCFEKHPCRETHGEGCETMVWTGEDRASLADALIDALTDYAAFRHVIDNYDKTQLADLQSHLLAAATTALRAEREAALEEAAKIAAESCLVPPDGGSPTEGEWRVAESAAARIRSLKSPAGQKEQANG